MKWAASRMSIIINESKMACETFKNKQFAQYIPGSLFVFSSPEGLLQFQIQPVTKTLTIKTFIAYATGILYRKCESDRVEEMTAGMYSSPQQFIKSLYEHMKYEKLSFSVFFITNCLTLNLQRKRNKAVEKRRIFIELKFLEDRENSMKEFVKFMDIRMKVTTWDMNRKNERQTRHCQELIEQHQSQKAAIQSASSRVGVLQQQLDALEQKLRKFRRAAAAAAIAMLALIWLLVGCARPS